jgi:hypothetical protein
MLLFVLFSVFFAIFLSIRIWIAQGGAGQVSKLQAQAARLKTPPSLEDIDV